MTKECVTVTELPAHMRGVQQEFQRTRQDGAGGGGGDGGGDAAVRFGIMFGRESSGLTNDEVARAGSVVTINANPEYPVLNMAMAIGVIVHALYNEVPASSSTAPEDAALASGGLHPPPLPSQSGAHVPQGTQAVAVQPSSAGEDALATPASMRELDAYLERLYRELSAVGFFEVPDKEASVRRSIRNMYSRMRGLSSTDVALLQGILTRLRAGNKQQRQ